MPVRAVSVMQAVLRITVSPWDAITAPLACFATFPVRNTSGVPPIITEYSFSKVK